MKRIRYEAGGLTGFGTQYRTGNEKITIPAGSQITLIRVIPGYDPDDPNQGTWFSINNGGPIFLTSSLCLDGHVFDYCCECDIDDCNRYPGNVQIEMRVGPVAAPKGAQEEQLGLPAQEWQVWYVEGGCAEHRRKGD